MNNIIHTIRHTARAATVLLLALLTAQTVWADGLSGSGTAADPYIIANSTDWTTFATAVSGGTTYEGKTVKLTADIDGITTIAGTSDNRFKGTFVGGGHTLTVNYTATANDCAPFLCIEGATINTLKVAGTISTGYKYAAGIAAHSYGNTTIQNCQSSVAITSTISDDGTHAGFVAVLEGGSLSMTNCLFDGSMAGASTTNCGGLVGWRNATLTFTNCMMAGTMGISQTNGSALFNRNGSSTLMNCYYDGGKSYGSITVQGTSTTATGEALRVLLGSGWEVSGDKAVPVMSSTNFTLAAISGLQNFYVYTGNNINISYTVTAVDGTVLTKGTDFTESISPATVKDKGDYTLTITGSGNYSGSQTFYFTVGDIPATPSGMSVDNGYSYPEAGYFYVNMPTTSTASVNIPEGLTSFKVYDNGGKNGNYSYKCNGYLTIIVPENCTLQLSGEVKLTSTNSTVESGANPIFKVFDGTSSGTQITSVWGWGSGYERNIGTLNSTGNTVTLYLYNDMTQTSGAGADITVTVISPDTEYDVSIANGIEHGSITTDKNKAGADETITLTATPESGYLLNGISVTDRYSNTVPVSFTPWYKGATGATTATFIMPKSNATVTATFTKIDNTNNAFSINLPKTGTETGTIPSGVVSFKVYDDGGASGNYSPNCNGSITLTAPSGYGFQIDGRLRTYQSNGNLTISNSKETLLDKVHGEALFADADYNISRLVSNDQTLSITFYSNESSTNTGVDLIVTMVNLSQEHTVTVGSAEHGTMTASPVSAAVGTTVTLTATPDNTYYLSGVTATYTENGQTKNLAVSGGWWTNNQVTFTMPYADVSVTPAFTQGNADGYPIIAGLDYVTQSDNTPGYYKIDSANALNTLANYVNSGNSVVGVLFKQTEDIDMNGQSYTPIGNDESHAFSGVYDGSGYVILNINHNTNNNVGWSGLFGNLQGTVKNVNLKDCTFKGGRAGSIVGYVSNGTIQNCAIIGGSVSCPNDCYSGGIVGWLNSGTVSGCFTTTSAGCDGQSESHANGSIVGVNRGTVTNNFYTVPVTNGNSEGGTQVYGGFITAGEDVMVGSGVWRTVGKTAANTYYFGEQNNAITFTAEVPTAGMKKFTTTAGTLSGTTSAGTVTLTMPASDATVSFEDVTPTITLADIDLTFTGTEKTPAITSVTDGETIMTAGTDYNDVAYTNNTNAGKATVTITGKGVYLGTASTSFTISPASVTLTANSRNTDTYDGTEKTVTGYTSSVDGLTFAESVSASGSGTNAGEYDVTFSGVKLNETKDNTGNYVITATTNGKFAIAPKPVTVTANNQTKEYGADDPTLTYTCDGLVGGDELTGTLSREAGKDVGDYAINLGTLANSNYTLTLDANGAKLSITPKPITVSGITAVWKTYDGTADATLDYSAATISGLVSEDDLIVTATGTFTDANAGEGKVVAISSITLGGTSAANYVLADQGQQTSATASITKATPMVGDFKFSKPAELAYNGSVKAATISLVGTKTGAGDITMHYFKGGNEVQAPVAAGTYTLKIDVAGGDNFVAATALEDDSWTFTITEPADGADITIALTEKYGTYCSAYDLDFSGATGLTAYIAAGYNKMEHTLLMVKVTSVPKGTGLLLKGTEGSTYTVKVQTSPYVYSNLLTGTTAETNVTADDFILGMKDNKVGFYHAKEGTLPAGKAYLDHTKLGTSTSGAPMLNLEFYDDATAIRANIREIDGGDQWYTLDGRKLQSKPTVKGLYILNGKKTVVR